LDLPLPSLPAKLNVRQAEGTCVEGAETINSSEPAEAALMGGKEDLGNVDVFVRHVDLYSIRGTAIVPGYSWVNLDLTCS